MAKNGEDVKVPKWRGGFFSSKHYNTLEAAVEDVLTDRQLQDYLRRALDADTGLKIGFVSYRDFAPVNVSYGLTLDFDEDPEGQSTLYFHKDPHVMSPPDNLGDVRFSHGFRYRDWESGHEFERVPKAPRFVNQLNDTLKRPHKNLEQLFPYENG